MRPIDIAFTQYGVEEIPGGEDNPDIIHYFNELGFPGERLKDETAWCAAFANYCLKMAGQYYCKDSLKARDLLGVGMPVQTPQFGDLVVLWRGSPDSWKGHTGFFIGSNARQVFLLGGNQGNQVCVAPYDIKRVLGYRRFL